MHREIRGRVEGHPGSAGSGGDHDQALCEVLLEAGDRRGTLVSGVVLDEVAAAVGRAEFGRDGLLLINLGTIKERVDSGRRCCHWRQVSCRVRLPPPTSETWSETSSFEFAKVAKRRGR